MNGFDNTQEIGINAAKSIVDSYGWIFREITKRDIGIDAEAESPEGFIIKMQIKTGESHFYRTNYSLTFYFDKEHYDYWSKLKVPVFIIAHLPEGGKTYYEYFHNSKIVKTKKGYKIEISLLNELTSSSKNNILLSIIDLKDGDVAIKFENFNEKNTLKYLGPIVDTLILRELEKGGSLISANERLVEISERWKEDGSNWSKVIECKERIYSGDDVVKWRLRLIDVYLRMKQYNNARAEIFTLIVKYENSFIPSEMFAVDKCRRLNELIDQNPGIYEQLDDKDIFGR